MKQNKLKKLTETARKKISKTIELNLITELTTVSATFGTVSKKLEKSIKKGSKQLAKRLSNQIVIDKSTLIAEHQEAKVAKSDSAASAE